MPRRRRRRQSRRRRRFVDIQDTGCTRPQARGSEYRFTQYPNRPDDGHAYRTARSTNCRRRGKTALDARYAPLPFYFSAKPVGLSFNLVVATDRFPSSSADPFEMIARRYDLPIAPAPKSARLSVIPVSDDDRGAVKAILKQDYGAGGYIPITQTRLVASFANARLKSGQLNQDDIELVRALLKQHAFAAPIDSKLPPSTYQALKPLLPDMFERIADRSDGQNDMVESLNVMLDHFSAEDTNPYSLALCQQSKNADLDVCNKGKSRNGHRN
jgi:hypothetical protein